MCAFTCDPFMCDNVSTHTLFPWTSVYLVYILVSVHILNIKCVVDK